MESQYMPDGDTPAPKVLPDGRFILHDVVVLDPQDFIIRYTMLPQAIHPLKK
jgi:hypothetical protein